MKLHVMPPLQSQVSIMTQTSEHVFISYAREDIRFVKKLAGCLTEKGCSVWWDFSLIPGYRFREEIASKIDSAKSVIVIWSKYSVVSGFVLDEAARAAKQNKLVPLSILNTAPPLGFGNLHTMPIHNLEKEIDLVVAAINRAPTPELRTSHFSSKRRFVRLGVISSLVIIGSIGAFAYADRHYVDSAINCVRFGCDLNYVTYRSDILGVKFVYPMKQLSLDTTKEYLGRLPMFNQRGDTEAEICVSPMPPHFDVAKGSADEKRKLHASGNTITYSPAQKDWYVISGRQPDGLIYYVKRWYLTDRILSIEFHYRPELKPIYDKIILDMTLRGIKTYDLSERVFALSGVSDRTSAKCE
jgi:hypothetical protein